MEPFVFGHYSNPRYGKRGLVGRKVYLYHVMIIYLLFLPKPIYICIIQCLGMANIQAGAGHPTLVSYDSEGLVFAGGAYIKERHLIKLYDARNYT